MSDMRMQPLLEAWFKDREATPHDVRHSTSRVMARVPQVRQRGRWWPLPVFDRPAPIPATNGPTPARGFTMFSAVKFVVAGVIVALFGGFLLAGVLTTPQGDEMAPAAVTESPSPMTTEELLSGMVTEEVEPGVYRVLNDGVRDLTSADYGGVFAGQDGSIWLDHSGYPSRLGVAETHDGWLGERDYLMDIEVAHDGTVWATDGSTLRSLDGETWTTHRAVAVGHGIVDVEVASDGSVWASLGYDATHGYVTLGYLDADGSTWQTVEPPTTMPESDPDPPVEAYFSRAIVTYGFIVTESDVWVPDYAYVWHYTDGAWEYTTYGGPDTAALPDDVFWGVGGGMLYRHDVTGWRQWSLRAHDMMGPGWDPVPYAVAPDGSFWAGWYMEDGGSYGGVTRFDGRTPVRYLPGMFIGGMDIAPDGSVWLVARSGPPAGTEGPWSLYVITPEAVAATE